MKILYGVQGTGNGHISRARIMAKYFSIAAKQHNIEVTFLFSGRKLKNFFEMECFGTFLHRDGLTFHTESGKINYCKTVTTNNIPQFLIDISQLDVKSYDLIISDFEPITAWAGKLRHKTVLGIGHQYAFSHAIPLEGDNFSTRAIMRYFAPATNSIALHWYHFNQQILPPIIDTTLKPEEKNSTVLVYLPFENQSTVTELLNNLPDHHFIQYSSELNDSQLHNVQLRKTSHQGFKQDLSSCSAVICNSGFELISECLHLNTPVLTKPLHGQMEQLSNAKALEILGYANSISVLSKEAIEQWLNSKKTLNSKPLPNVAKALVKWIIGGDLKNTEQLTKQLWC